MPSKSTQPSDLVKEALAATKTKALRREHVDWGRLEPDLLLSAEACKNLAEAHALIRELLGALEDKHSFLWTPDDAKQALEANHSGLRVHQLEPVIIDVFPDSPAERAGIRVGDTVTAVNGTSVDAENWRPHIRQVLDAGTKLELNGEGELVLKSGFVRPNPQPQGYLYEGYGVIDLPGTWGEGELSDGTNYADVVRDLLHGLEAEGASAWIIDLRRNDGGNMWPMFAGLTPLLDVGEYGAFVDSTKSAPWVWTFDGERLGAQQNGAFFEDYITPVNAFKPLAAQNAPIAILTSAVTSSSGEIVLIGLRGRPEQRSFGLATGGIPSCNETIILADGSWLILTTYLCANQHGQIYEGALEPDEVVKIKWNAFAQPHDPVLAAAKRWLDGF